MDNQITKRELTSSDFSLWSQYFVAGTTLESFEKLIKQLNLEKEQDKSYSFLLEQGVKVIGFVQLFNVLRGHTHSAMIEIGITEENRNQGYGKLAMKVLEDFGFNELGLLRLVAPISAENSASIALFRSLGYQKAYTDPSAFFFKGKPSSLEIYVKLKPSAIR